MAGLLDNTGVYSKIRCLDKKMMKLLLVNSLNLVKSSKKGNLN
jgi:hypothetical protein